ncbi:MAG: hypothetical protein PHT85_03210 [Methylovulum sp.]|nr:hypothetical protein [Methylovulum sp.]
MQNYGGMEGYGFIFADHKWTDNLPWRDVICVLRVLQTEDSMFYFVCLIVRRANSFIVCPLFADRGGGQKSVA